MLLVKILLPYHITAKSFSPSLTFPLTLNIVSTRFGMVGLANTLGVGNVRIHVKRLAGSGSASTVIQPTIKLVLATMIVYLK